MMVAWPILTRRAIPPGDLQRRLQARYAGEYDATPEGQKGSILRREGLVLRARDRVPPGP